MSAPVHRDNETNDLQFYPRLSVRERPAAAASEPDERDSTPTAACSADADIMSLSPASPGVPESVTSPAPDQPVAEPMAEVYERVLAAARAMSSPRMAPGVGGPNVPALGRLPPRADPQGLTLSPTALRTPRADNEWSAASRRGSFEGDVGIKTLRNRVSLDSEFVPAPPIRGQRKAILRWLSWGSAVAAFGIVFVIQQPPSRDPLPKTDESVSAVAAPQPARPQLAAVSLPLAPPARLVAEDRQAFMNEAILLGISLNGGIGGESVVLSGLVPGMRISVGSSAGANLWRVPARDLVPAFAYPPKDFAGVMETTIDVRTDNDVLVDSRSIRLAWLPKQSEAPNREPHVEHGEPVQPAAAPSIDAEELATLMRRGQEFLKTGDIAAARLVLRRAANAGHQQAALTLGATFDPVVLEELGVLGSLPDLAQARLWYDKAARLGSEDALRRIERLARARN
jgi:hypothetical protein